MRYRQLSPTGDYVFGQGSQNFYIDIPATVGQLVKTELLLHQGEWFLNLAYGMPWETQVLGRNTAATRDAAIKTLVLGMQGVTQINSYTSSLNAINRTFTVNMTITTIYSNAPIPVVVIVPIGGYGVCPYGTEGYGI